MKILMLLDNQFPPDIRVEKEAKSLLNEGHEVAILSYNYKSSKPEEIVNGSRVFRFPINKQVSKKILGFSLQLPFYRLIWQRAIKKVAKEYTFDVIHIHDLPLCTLIAFIKARYHVPVIADMHENFPFLVAEQPYMNSLFARIFLNKGKWFGKEKEWLARADSIICVAEEMKSRIESVIELPKPIVVVPNTPEIDELKGSMTNASLISERFSGTYNVLYIGGLDSTRGIEILIKASEIALKTISALRIIIVGDGKILPDLIQLTHSLHLENTVFFEGFKPQDEVGSYISISDVCVIPHRKSPQTDNSSPNKLFQYLYFKKPVISSDCNSIEKIIFNEKCGLIFHDISPEELAERIIFLYENPIVRNEMGENGYRAVTEKYNWNMTVAPLLSLYSELNN
jgi:glycosyltransferase involved in cell wall biosynthesis